MRELLSFCGVSALGPDSDVISRSSIFLARNLADTPFPWRSSLPQLAESRKRIMQAVSAKDSRFFFNFFEDLPREALLLARERGYLPETVSASGAGAFALTADASRSLLINAREHVCFGVHRCGRTGSEDLASLLSLESVLDGELPWAFVSSEGYVQTNPDDTGSGLSLGCRVFLPAIVSADIWERVARGLVASGMHIARSSCEESDMVIDADGPESSWIDIVFNAEPGQTESGTLEAFLSSLQILCDTERKARMRQMESLPSRAKDRAWRALALLRSVRLLEEIEAHVLLSRVRLGVLMEILPSVNTHETILLIDKLETLSSKSAINMANTYNTDVTEDILDTQIRADFVRAAIVDHFPPL